MEEMQTKVWHVWYLCIVDHAVSLYTLKFTEDDLQLRTEEIYNAHCEGLDGPLGSHIATTYGVANKSVLNDCQYFHVVNGLVPDIMHDILEG